MSHNYKLTIAYDGTQYKGWQIQPNGLSIQEVIQKAMQIFMRDAVQIIGSGRTDAGVHASGQVAHFKTSREIDLRRFLVSINGLLPHDIRLLKAEEVDMDFHSQYSAIGKIYHYHLYLDKIQMPFRLLYSYHLPTPLDIVLLEKAAAQFLGTHDFTAFANSALQGSAARDPIRTITRLQIVPEEGGLRLEFEGDGFLYKMVRNIVGTLLEVAQKKRPVDDIAEIFASQDRRRAGRAAPPQGLFLVQVHY